MWRHAQAGHFIVALARGLTGVCDRIQGITFLRNERWVARQPIKGGPDFEDSTIGGLLRL
jgi:hypothetical protein